MDRNPEKLAPTYWPNGPNNKEAVGPVGDGTPHARMHWFWDVMDYHHEDLIEDLVPEYSPISNMRFEVAIFLAFEILAQNYIEQNIERK